MEDPTGPMAWRDFDSLLREPAPDSQGLVPESALGGARDAGSGQTTANDSAAEMQQLMETAEEALAAIDAPNPSQDSIDLRQLVGTPQELDRETLERFGDIELDLKIELGRTRMDLQEVLKLKRGSVVILDQLAGDPVNIYANDRLIARGEVVVVNENFSVRVTELVESLRN